MAKILHCSDAGFACDAVLTGATVEDLLAQVRPHARSEHDLDVTPELQRQLAPLIRDDQLTG